MLTICRTTRTTITAATRISIHWVSFASLEPEPEPAPEPTPFGAECPGAPG